MGEKDFFASKATWGAIILLIAPALAMLDIEITDQQGLVDALTTIIGLAVFVVGQFKRKTKIGSIAGLPVK